jgi:DNA gyrase subunit A
LTQERFDQLAEQEQLILSITENGYGKRTSAYEYRVTKRGGQGIINIVTSARNGKVVAAGPIGERDQVVLVTDGGKLIRTPIDDIRIAGRNTQGVTLFNVAEDERVVSVTRLGDTGDDDPEDAEDDPEDAVESDEANAPVVEDDQSDGEGTDR